MQKTRLILRGSIPTIPGYCVYWEFAFSISDPGIFAGSIIYESGIFYIPEQKQKREQRSLKRERKMQKKTVETLSREELQDVILRMQDFLSEQQAEQLQNLIEEYGVPDEERMRLWKGRMSQEFVDEKMRQIARWKQQIDDGELYLYTEGYEDYSNGYWDAEWVTEYYDPCGIGDKILSMIRFVGDCVDDRRYQEANEICEWLWEMTVSEDNEFGDPADLETLAENDLIHADLKQFALLTLYADYQILDPEERAADLYLYFSHSAFSVLHMEEMFSAGRENLKDTDRFWRDWICLLKSKKGNTEARLLKEAVLYTEGTEGLSRLADENALLHPSLYLSVMAEYEKGHLYEKIEETGKRAMDILDVEYKIRGEIARRSAVASSYLDHEEEMMQFCWECYRSDSNVKNYLRLFGTEEMAERYGMRGGDVLPEKMKGNPEYDWRETELSKNMPGTYEYYRLCFFSGKFEKVKNESKNPKGSLGWSSSFIQVGIRLFLLYLYENLLPSKAAAATASDIGFSDEKAENDLMTFEREILNESREHKVSEFWNYFQRWKRYFPMGAEEKKKYLTWAEKIVYSRADAIVSGQHRRHYGQAAVLLAVIGEIKESAGEAGAGKVIFETYKRKFPRHSAFQGCMREFFCEG